MGMLRPNQAAKFLGVSKATLWRWGRDMPEFPRPFRLGAWSIGYDEQELSEWLSKRRISPPSADPIQGTREVT